MRLYSQPTSGQILFSALSNWEFFMVKDKKKKRGWKNLLRKLTDTTHLFEMKWRLERREKKGKQSGKHSKAMFLARPQAGEMSQPDNG